MNSAIVFGIGSVLTVAVATATFIWGFMHMNLLRTGDERVMALADAAIADAATAREAQMSVASSASATGIASRRDVAQSQ